MVTLNKIYKKAENESLTLADLEASYKFYKSQLKDSIFHPDLNKFNKLQKKIEVLRDYASQSFQTHLIDNRG